MKYYLISVLLAMTAAVTVRTPIASRVGLVMQKEIAVCGSSFPSLVKAGENGKFIPAMPGWGGHSYEITAAHDSARFYFNQGLSMYYSYHMKEALASFKEAARFDPGSAMTHWGQALTMGPYYNAAHTYEIPESITGVLMAMNQNMANASTKEKHLIKAMRNRYPANVTGSKLKALDAAYALEMKNLVKLYPDDDDIKMLYIDAVMLMHAWDFWNFDGTKKPWTGELVKMCAQVVKSNAEHPAALHYYIHLTEASRNPEVALANAGALENLFPGVAHMVHMTSHAYQRNGLYGQGVRVNNKADSNLINYESIAKNLALGKHSSHYFAVQTYCALTGGMYNAGLQSAERCRKSVSPTPANTYDQYLYMMPALVQVRLGKWKELLRDSMTPDPGWAYANLIHHFARGMAFVNTSQPDSAAVHLAQLRKYQQDKSLQKRRIPFNAPAQSAYIAENILEASILFSENKVPEALRLLREAVVTEDKLIYTEPADWPLPARQFLGAFLLKSGKAAQAEKVYRQDLLHNPGNGWSLRGLYQSVAAQRKNKEQALYKSRYEAAFANAEEIPAGSVIIK